METLGNISVPTTDIVPDLNKLEAHLDELHRRTAGVEGAAAFVPLSRTVLLNLVVFVASPKDLPEIAESVVEIMGTHPCRAIVVSLGGKQTGEAPASVSAVCGITERGDRRLCGEIIELHPENPAEDIVGMVMPVLVPDAPVFVWVTDGVPCGNDIYAGIMDATDHVMVDSRTFTDMRTQLAQLIEECVESAFDKSLQDLAWVSLLTWRDLTAQHFDPPQARDYLYGLEKVSVRFARGNGSHTPPSAPLLFASWLMERTDTHVTDVSLSNEDVWVITGRQADHDVRIELIPEQYGSARGRLRSVSIQAKADSQSASFYIQGVSATEVTVTEECVGVCYPPLVVELPVEDEGALVAKALDNKLRDKVYEAAASVACDILSRTGESV